MRIRLVNTAPKGAEPILFDKVVKGTLAGLREDSVTLPTLAEVESSACQAVGFDGARTVVVKYNAGRVYAYWLRSDEVADRLSDALDGRASIGSTLGLVKADAWLTVEVLPW